jgi:hypothetical protein
MVVNGLPGTGDLARFDNSGSYPLCAWIRREAWAGSASPPTPPAFALVGSSRLTIGSLGIANTTVNNVTHTINVRSPCPQTPRSTR